MAKSYSIETIGGQCPVQAEGRIGGKTEFYFRSRGERWSLSIGGRDVILRPKWYYEEPCGSWPEAGWISEEQARSFIDKAIHLYWDGHPSAV